jgi:hypothetical protein
LGRDIPLQTRQVGFGISAAMPLCWNQPNLTSESVWFPCLENLHSRTEVFGQCCWHYWFKKQ